MENNKKFSNLKGFIIANVITSVLAILIVIAGVIGVAVARDKYEPEYVATATINVTVKDDVEASYEAVEKVAGEITGTSELELLSKYLGVAQFTGTIDAEIIPDTTLIEVTVTGDNDEKVYDVLRYVTQMRPKLFYGLSAFFNDVSITVVEMPADANLVPNYGEALTIMICGILIVLVMLASLAFNVIAIVSTKREESQDIVL